MKLYFPCQEGDSGSHPTLIVSVGERRVAKNLCQVDEPPTVQIEGSQPASPGYLLILDHDLPNQAGTFVHYLAKGVLSPDEGPPEFKPTEVLISYHSPSPPGGSTHNYQVIYCVPKTSEAKTKELIQSQLGTKRVVAKDFAPSNLDLVPLDHGVFAYGG